MIRAVIFGASGYAGQKLIEILLLHPKVEITGGFVSESRGDTELSNVFPKIKGVIDLKCESRPDWKKIEEMCDVIFLALPHSISMNLIPEIININKKVVDLSSDFRFKNLSTYEKFYVKHSSPQYLEDFVYGLPELNRSKIRETQNVSNPGCYPTSVILALLPLVKEKLISRDIIVDSKSGVTGAGKGLKLENIFAECNENMKAYKIGEHRHTPEIEETLLYASGKEYEITFVPHLAPFNLGILSTCYLNLKTSSSGAEIQSLYEEFYKDEPFVRIMDYSNSPSIKDVVNTNFCDIGVKLLKNNRLVIISAIDNLLKGAAGQAVQNMNLMFGVKETIPFFHKSLTK